MNSFWNGLLLGILAGVIAGIIMALFLRRKRSAAAQLIDENAAKKAENLKKVEDFIADKDRFTNDDIQNLLGVSNTTTGRYLDELEAAGKIIQHGDTGKGVYYTKN